MKQVVHFIIIASCIILVGFTSHAKSLGAGIILFGPTGPSANYFLNQNHSIDAALSWSLNNDNQNLYLHSTYLWHNRDLLKVDNVKLDAFFGAGVRMVSWRDPPGKRSDSETRLGMRGVAGTGYTFKNPAIEVFGELSLVMDVVPETDIDLGLGIGARYYF